MTYPELQKKTLALIEEYNAENEDRTDDPDIAAKFMSVTNQVAYELARIKKLPRYVEISVKKDQILDFSTIGAACDARIYQINVVRGVCFEYKADGTVLKFKEDGTAEIDCYVYPEYVTEGNAEDYVFPQSDDVLEIMPYGIAADLLKSDVSSEYGSVYATRYEQMLQRLDPRNHMPSIYIDGGVMI